MLSRSVPTDGPTVEARFTGSAAGDLGLSAPDEDRARRREAIHPRPWAWMRQVHGADVVEVSDRDRLPAGVVADALVTGLDAVPLAVQTADCGPVLFVGRGGPFGVAHAGWRGVAAGVLGATANALQRLGSGPLSAVIGPTIGPECYEFGVRELDQLVKRFGSAVRSETSWGAPAFDLRMAITRELVGAGLAGRDIEIIDACTACSPGYFSHRARGETQRQALVAWRVPTPSPKPTHSPTLSPTHSP